MSSPTNINTQNVEASGAFDQTGRIMVVSIIVLLVVIIFVVFLHLYAKWYWHRVSDGSNNINHHRRRRMDFAAGHRELSAGIELRHGLDSAFLKTIPVVLFSLQDFEDGLECSVCLSEVSEGENTRLLPKCNHGFHVECIDMWFQSHSTCPICRNPVLNSNPTTTTPDLSQEMVRQDTTTEVDQSDNGGGISTEALSFPTNVLYWGNEVQVSTLASCLENDDVASSASSSVVIATGGDDNTGDGHLVIDIPRQIVEDEDQKSPVQTRLRSLKKLLSRDRKINHSSPTTATGVEQAAGRSQT